ncbi:MAG TPA: amidohydrolase family protein [Verrucomicrobiae bacterium]|jgi:L-fuconolactonase|nr:amidohydrolase family protein [Verrucomicrobiae bacterium]
MKIDSHQHFWKASRGDYHWMSPAVQVLCRDYLPADLEPHLKKNKIDKTILVQAAQTKEETDFLLELAAQHGFIAGVIGWLDMDSPEFPRELDIYAKKPKFLGVRPMLQDLPDDDWILRPRVIESLKWIADRDMPFEFLTYTRHLPHVLTVLDKVPDLRAVVDHVSKPEIKNRKLDPWRSLMSRVAEHKNVYCKLSGMITEADHKTWTPNDLRPYVEHVLECFGVDRVMFGSDWPVCLLAGSYDQVAAALQAVVKPRLDKSGEAALFGENATRFYKLAL